MLPTLIPHGFGLRRAVPDDAPALASLVRDAFGDLAARSYDEPTRRRALAGPMRIDPAMLEDGSLWLVEDACKELAACIGWTARPADDTHRTLLARHGGGLAACLRSLFVHPRFAGRGLGSSLVASVEREAARAGLRRVVLLATMNAAPLYARLGYAAHEVVEIPLGDGHRMQGTAMSKAAPVPGRFTRRRIRACYAPLQGCVA